MAPYSMDLRKRVARAWDADPDADAIAAKYEVSRAWVHRLIQRRRETGSLAPRKQTKFRSLVLAGRVDTLTARHNAKSYADKVGLTSVTPASAAPSSQSLKVTSFGL